MLNSYLVSGTLAQPEAKARKDASMLPAEEVLTVDEVARYLRVHPMTVQRWCRTGELPAAKIGRAYRIKKGDLDEWWAQHTPRGEPPESRPSRPVEARNGQAIVDLEE